MKCSYLYFRLVRLWMTQLKENTNQTTLKHFKNKLKEISTTVHQKTNLKSKIRDITYLIPPSLPPSRKAVKRRALPIQSQKGIKHPIISLGKQKQLAKASTKMYLIAFLSKFGTFGDLDLYERMGDLVCILETSLQKQMDFQLLFHPCGISEQAFGRLCTDRLYRGFCDTSSCNAGYRLKQIKLDWNSSVFRGYLNGE